MLPNYQTTSLFKSLSIDGLFFNNTSVLANTTTSNRSEAMFKICCNLTAISIGLVNVRVMVVTALDNKIQRKYTNICSNQNCMVVWRRNVFYYSDVTWAPWRFESPNTRLFVQQLVQANKKWIIKAWHCLSLCEWNPPFLMYSLHTWPVMNKAFTWILSTFVQKTHAADF